MLTSLCLIRANSTCALASVSQQIPSSTSRFKKKKKHVQGCGNVDYSDLVIIHCVSNLIIEPYHIYFKIIIIINHCPKYDSCIKLLGTINFRLRKLNFFYRE